MLFAYTYVPHQMEKMQTFIDFIFYEVWCKAPIGLEFSLALFDEKPDLKEVLLSFGYSNKAPAHGKRFYKEIKAIYALFKALSPEEIDRFKQWYKANNEIERACNNEENTKLSRYKDISNDYADLSNLLSTFFKGLYSRKLLECKALKDKIGNINDHYHSFIKKNRAAKCPFCGIHDIKGENHSYREAYDHYLPKSLYPFNTINFHNLVPACHECNSYYKGSKDPAHNHHGRRMAFYPYATELLPIELKVDLLHTNIAALSRDDIDIRYGPAAVSEQIETWKDVYGIDERYKAKLCGENDGKYWLTQVLDEWKEDGREPAEFISALTRQAEKRPFAECNFLKKPFLDACQSIGLFESPPQQHQPAGLESNTHD